ncbi:MAG: hypothetical protein F4029_10890 [Gammaproteobacteria bacterium]|nr:hypothetical protein [Gammaproteobacteria bacterium]MYF31069.1 hypothetical protein [Gammaproteobacteria bacterium]MYK46720.1 hypothetical protein [Gammaproteobacteria bacterium]
MTPNRIRAAYLGVALLALAMPSRTLAEDGIYVGVAVVGAQYGATYDKTVDNTLANNASMLFAGQRLNSNDSTNGITYEAGVVFGLRGSRGALFYGIEVDWTTHQGDVSGHLDGVGTTPLRNQVGENWPEDWELAKDQSYGLTARIGTGMPFAGATGYVLAGVRRVAADFTRSYTGCLRPGEICGPTQFQTASESFDEDFNAFVLGVGMEQPLASVLLRSEIRYVDHGSASQLVLFDDLGVSVSTSLEASEVGLGVSVLWTF